MKLRNVILIVIYALLLGIGIYVSSDQIITSTRDYQRGLGAGICFMLAIYICYGKLWK